MYGVYRVEHNKPETSSWIIERLQSVSHSHSHRANSSSESQESGAQESLLERVATGRREKSRAEMKHASDARASSERARALQFQVRVSTRASRLESVASTLRRQAEE